MEILTNKPNRSPALSEVNMPDFDKYFRGIDLLGLL